MPHTVNQPSRQCVLELSGDTADVLQAASLLRNTLTTVHPVDLEPVGRHWLERAEHHLNQRLDRSFRDRPPLTSEQAALAILKDAGVELHRAGESLRAAAEKLKHAGVGLAANHAMQAAQRALSVAQGLNG